MELSKLSELSDERLIFSIDDTNDIIDDTIENINKIFRDEEAIKDLVWKLSEESREIIKKYINYYSVT